MRISPRAQLWAASFGFVALLRLPSFTRQLFDPDEASIASQAITLQHGGRLYVDSIDRKPPVAPEIYRVFFDWFGNTLIPLHILVAVLLAIGGGVVASDLLRRHGNAAAWWGLALYIGGALAFLPDSGQAANYAHFALLPGTLAVVWARRGTWRWAVLAGLALGVATLCRQTWAIGIVPGALALWWPRRDRRGFAQGCLYVVVAVLTVASAALFFPPSDFWHWTFSSNEGFIASFGSASLVVPSFFGQTGLFVGFHLALAILLVVRLADRELRSRWGTELDLWVWTLTGGVAAFTGFRFFGHYFLQVLPAPVLLAAPVAATLASGIVWRRVLAGLIALAAVTAFVFAWMPRTLRSLPDPTPWATYVDAHTTADQSIFVWGNFPEIYWKSDRPTAGDFVSTDFIVGLSGNRAPSPSTLSDTTPGAIPALLKSLTQRPPTLILDTSTAGIRQYQHYPMTVIPRLWQWVQAHYVHVATVDGLSIYRLKN